MAVQTRLDNKNNHFIINGINAVLAVRREGSQEALERCLGNLIGSAIKDFFHEEAMMSKGYFRGTEDHKRKHDAFIMRAQSFLRRTQDGTDQSLFTEILDFLTEWYDCHVMVDDKLYALYVDSRLAANRM